MAEKSTDLTEGPLLKKIILYTIPVILTGISVAAVGDTTAVINLLVNLFIGLSVGVGVTVAHGLGAGKDEEVQKTVHTAIPTAFVCGVILTVIGILVTEPVLKAMDTPEDVIDLSATYMKVYFAGITSSMLYNFGSAILRAAGDTKSPLIYLTISGVVNVILNLFFVRVVNMNVAGVALATSISQTISAILTVRSLMIRKNSCKLELKKMRFYKRPLIRMTQIGLPAGIQSSLFSISNVIIQSSVNSFGSVVVAGNSAAQNIEGFVYTSMNSVSQTAMNFTGQNHGSGKFDRIKKIMIICLACVFVTGFAMGGIGYIFGRPLLSIYITDSTESIEYGMIRMAYILIPYFMCGLMDVATGMLRGIGSSLVPMIISVAGVCGFRIFWIRTIFQMPQYHTLSSIYVSYIISWSMTFIAEFITFVIVLKKSQKKYAKTKT